MSPFTLRASLSELPRAVDWFSLTGWDLGHMDLVTCYVNEPRWLKLLKRSGVAQMAQVAE